MSLGLARNGVWWLITPARFSWRKQIVIEVKIKMKNNGRKTSGGKQY